MLIPGLSWPSSALNTSTCSSPERAMRIDGGSSSSNASARNVLGIALWARIERISPASRARSSPWSDVHAVTTYRSSTTGSAMRRTVSPLRWTVSIPVLPRCVLRRMSHRKALTVGRLSLALHSRSGGSNETSTSVASSGTVARKNASRLSSMRSSTTTPDPSLAVQCSVARHPTTPILETPRC